MPGREVKEPARRRFGWLAIAGTAAIALALGAIAWPAWIAWLTPTPAPAPTLAVPLVPRRTPEEVAAMLRHEALSLCDENRWVSCERDLDEARKLDPGGENDPRVQEARALVHRAIHSAGSAPENQGGKPE